MAAPQTRLQLININPACGQGGRLYSGLYMGVTIPVCHSNTLHSAVNNKQKQPAQYHPRQRLVMTGYSTQLMKIINFKTTALTGQIYDEFYKFASKQEIPASNF